MSKPYTLSPEQIARLKSHSRREKLHRTISYFSPLLLLLLWEICSQTGLIDRRFFPAPSSIAGTAWQMTASLEIFDHIGATLRRVAIGYVLGAVPSILLGLVLGLSAPIRRVLGPIFSALYPVPKIAILPLILLIFGVGDASKYVVIAIGVFFLMFYNTLGGVMQIPQIYLDVARNAGASRFQTFRYIALPSAMPNIFTGLKLAAGSSYIIIAAAEFLGARSGVGFMIWASWQTFVAIASCSRNRRLVALSESLFDELERLLRFAIDFTVKAGEHSDEHTALVDAIEAGDGDRAASIEAEHIKHSREFLIERLSMLGYLSQVKPGVRNDDVCKRSNRKTVGSTWWRRGRTPRSRSAP